MSVLVNGTYWAPNVPRLLTYDDARNLLKTMNRSSAYGGCPSLPHRLLAICDISADTEVIIQYHTIFCSCFAEDRCWTFLYLNSVQWTATSQTVNINYHPRRAIFYPTQLMIIDNDVVILFL